jgi:medium-chain acyl-[acyl-carrier-protein] hydrolase
LEQLSLYKKNYHVDYGDSDYYKRLKLSALFNYLQDIASLHSENTNLGIEKLQNDLGVAWVMIRIMLDIKRMPVCNENIVVETWPLQPKKMEIERDFVVSDTDGSVLVSAVSNWVVLDMEKREIQKMENVVAPENYVFIEKKAIDRRMGRLKAAGQLYPVFKKSVGYSDIDINGHVNNSKYIDFIADCFSLEEHEKHSVKSIQVNYISEALAGDTISLYKDASGMDSENKIVYIEGIDEAADKVYFKASIEFE